MRCQATPLQPARSASALAGGVRARDVLRFNAAMPVLAVLAVVVGVVVAVSPVPDLVRVVGAAGALVALYLLVASTLVTFLVFERSGLTRYAWLPDFLGGPPARWVNVTTGFDDTTGTLARLWPDSSMLAVDWFDPSVDHEAALLRARAIRPPVRIAVRPGDSLPVADASVDAVFLLLAAHEVRDQHGRTTLFSDIARILEPGGRLVIVEHARDLANGLAFGPGVLHFHPPTVWRLAGTQAGLRLIDEARRTPFVRVFVFECPTAF